jgi:hypothetical protein
MRPISRDERLEFGGHAHNAGPGHPLVLVFGDEGAREDVRGKLVDFGIECASAEDPASLALGRDAHVLGWVCVGAHAFAPATSRAPAWCIAVTPDGLPSSALTFEWPRESLAFVCTVLALRDHSGARPPSDIAIEQRVWLALHRTSVPRLRVHAENGKISIGGRIEGAFLRARMSALAEAIPGARGVEFLDG